MAKQITSKRRAKAITISLFLVGLAILSYLNMWWPGIMLVIGIPLALRQLLMGRRHDMIVTVFIFIGFFVITQYNIAWKMLVPILFILAACYIISREFLDSFQESEDEKEENLNIEIDEDEKD